MLARSARQIKAPLRNPTSFTRPVLRSRHRQLLRVRFSSTQASNDPRPTGSLNTLLPQQQHKTFYKTFGRPIAKVFLAAIFTYQLAYFFWVRLEQEETRAEMEGVFYNFLSFPGTSPGQSQLNNPRSAMQPNQFAN
ncbi:hypothetical protein E0Z10_g2593 [Xylaria hypoxylon]|uniref:Uncharacterized protein n=1 Tax=Xylaria hypoxylon TaxID=37992 RepID=A0A4Z0Z3F6_9PEZI|nr:hypothetical protein E0Z10_g2593 [Xylaria hypoxylon]